MMEQNDETIERRTAAFVQLFDKCESEGIALDSKEFVALSRMATSELGIQQKVNDLSDIKVEDLSAYELSRILSRARTAIKRIIELRTKFSHVMETVTKEDGTTERVITNRRYGPYHTNRQTKRGKNPAHKRAALRSCFASKIVADIKERNTVTTPPGM